MPSCVTCRPGCPGGVLTFGPLSDVGAPVAQVSICLRDERAVTRAGTVEYMVSSAGAVRVHVSSEASCMGGGKLQAQIVLCTVLQMFESTLWSAQHT